MISRGALQLPSIGTATATTGYNSQPFSLQGSSFNSTSGKAIGPLFQWQTEPTGNDSSSPAGTLNLLYGNGSGSPAETGLHIASTGLLTFATGQTFPGTGTITGVKAGTGLSGGGTSGNVTLSINTTFANEYYAQLAAANAFTKSQTITGNLTLNGTGNGIIFPDGTKQTTATTGGGTITGVTAGTDLTGGGTSGNVTLNLDTTKVPQLGAANTFTGLQTISVNGGNEALNVTQQATSGQTYGIIATNYSTGNRSSAILGSSLAGSGIAFGVDGYIVDNDGAGVFGADGNPLSQTGNSLSGTFGSGVWGDGSGIGLGIIGTTDNNTAVAAYNNSSTASAIQGWNENTANSTTALAPGVFGLSFAPKGIGMVGSGPVHSSTFSSYAGQAAYGVVGDGGPSNIGVLGVADTASAIFGVSTSSGTGVVGSSQNGTGVVGFSSTGFGVSAASTISDGVYGTSTRGTGIYGVSSSASGVYGEGDDKSGSGGAGVYALGENTAVGVFATTSGTASAIVGINDTDAGEFAAPAAMFITDSTSAAGQALVAGGSTQATQCEIDNFGDLYCAGNISSGQVLPDNRVVALYAVQSPENWFEDFGSGSLENGSASIQLEPTFRDTVNTSIDYHVFLTPRGECEGLYVATMTPTAFEVRELHHGKSSIAFDYRIVAKRNNYEHIRMEDVTKMHEGELAQIQKMVKQSMERPPSIKSISSQSQPQLPASIPAGAAVAATPIGIPVQTKKPAAPIQRHP